MRRAWFYLAVLIVYAMFAASGALGSEKIVVKGLNDCKKTYYSDIGGIEAKPGYEFLVTGFGIKYNGGKSVSIDPGFFAISIDSVRYPNSGATYYLGKKGLTPLPSVTLESGGYTEGYVAYEVPTDKRNSDIDLKYSGWEDISIDYQCN